MRRQSEKVVSIPAGPVLRWNRSCGRSRIQILALEHMARCNLPGHPALIVSFSRPENIKALRARLRKIDENLGDFEVEELVLYGKVEERLIKAGLIYDTAHESPCSPPEQV